MKPNTTPVITAERIRSIKPGETFVLTDIDEKKKSSIYTMVGYIRGMGCPSGVSGYTCTYNKAEKTCCVTALPRGIKRKQWRQMLAEKENN